jgi:hypothetical protein
MPNIFKPKRSNVASSIPTTSNLADGELAVNSADKKIFLRDGASIVEIANYSTGSGTGEISVRKDSVQVGTSITTLDFTGSGISAITASSGIATVNVLGSSAGPGVARTVNSYTASEDQTSFLINYAVPEGSDAKSYVDVYLNGAKLSTSQYAADTGTSIVLNEGASLNDIVEVVSFDKIAIGVATAGGTVGTGVTLLDFRGPGVSTVTVSSGVATINIEGGGGTSTPDISPVMMGMIF